MLTEHPLASFSPAELSAFAEAYARLGRNTTAVMDGIAAVAAQPAYVPGLWLNVAI